MNIYAKLKAAIDEKYPEDKVNELKKKKATAEQLDSIIGNGVFTTSIKDITQKELDTKLNDAQGRLSQNNTTLAENHQSILKKVERINRFCSLTTHNKLSSGLDTSIAS